MSPAQGRGAVAARGAVLACVLFAGCPCAFALNPALDVSQYAHTAWRLREGFSSGRIASIAQTTDGYLWLGTELGLLRFDGVRAVPWQPPSGQHLPDNSIRALLAGRDGTLWIGTLKGLASWNGAKLTAYPELAGRYVDALIEDRDGTVWASGSVPTGRLCAIQKSGVQCHGDDGSLGAAVESLHEDRGGNVWVGASTGLWRWKPGAPKRYPASDPVSNPHALIEDDKGALLISSTNGISRLVDGKIERYPVPAAERFRNSLLFRDRDGVLWMGSLGGGLVHVHEGRTDAFTQSDGLSSDSVINMFEDREGNIWVATSGGLDRFREDAVTTLTAKQGLSTDNVYAVLAAGDGSVWIATANGLNRWTNGRITVPRTASGKRDGKFDGLDPLALLQDDRGRIWVSTLGGIGYLENGHFVSVGGVPGGIVRSMVKDAAGNLWIASQGPDLVRVSAASSVQQFPWAELGHKDFALTLAADAMPGGLWLGFYQGGIAHLADGQVRASYAAADGLGGGAVTDLRLDRDGALWAATEGGLSRVKNGRVVTLTSKGGLPCDTVHWSIEDDAHWVWLNTACGLVRIARPEMDAWVAAADKTGANRGAEARPTIHTLVFDSSDGVTTLVSSGGFGRPVAKSSDGRLWFLGGDGVSVIDPGHLPFNKVPPPVHIERVTADDQTYDATNGLRLPPRIRTLAIDYTALSFVAPEKVRFRYKLEGQNRNWHEVINERRVQYTNLAPGAYRFRVMASNNNGVWNEAGDTLSFSIAPAYYQTRWFAAVVALGIAMLLWAAYQLRIRQLALQFHRTLDARVAERTRIARDLHDTLLQSFQGAVLRFQTVVKVLPAGSDEARTRLDRALDQAEAAITEGRNAVQGLRTSATTVNDLANGIAALGVELTSELTVAEAPAIDIRIDGESRNLNPLVRDEAFRIAGEALRNAIKHSGAQHVIVTIDYERRQLRLVIRDDGNGIDAETLARQQVASHFGLPGMRERAAVVNGQLEVRSEPGAGTAIELRVPARTAYLTRAASSSA